MNQYLSRWVDGLYGYIDAKGKWVITPRFGAANPNTAWVRSKGKYGRSDAKGKWVLPPQYANLDVPDVVTGLVRAQKDKGDKWGFTNATGEWGIPPTFYDIGIWQGKLHKEVCPVAHIYNTIKILG